MALNNIVLRSTPNPPLVTQFAELTYAQVDNNWIEIYNYLTAMNNGSSLNPWSIATTYSGTTYVSYAGNIYKLIAPSSTGEVPVSFPAVWELTSIGALAHIQNTDTKLDDGGSYEVTAQELYDIVNNQIINITYAGFIALLGNLIPNRIYQITDTASVGFGSITTLQPKFYIYSLGGREYSNVGLLKMYVPNVENWRNDGTYPIGYYVKFDGYVYENLTGSNNSNLSPASDGVNWIFVPVGPQYSIKSFDCDWRDDSGNIEILRAKDWRGNIYSHEDIVNGCIFEDNYIYRSNIVLDSESNINQLTRLHTAGTISGNILMNGSEFFFDVGGSLTIWSGEIKNNILDNATITCNVDNNNGDIVNCRFQNVDVNFPNGNDNLLLDLDIKFSNKKTINIINDTALIQGQINDKYSTVECALDISTMPALTLDIDSFIPYSDVFGVYYLITTATKNVYTLLKGAMPCKEITLKIDSGSTGNVVINTTPAVSLGANDLIVGSQASYTLRADYNESVTLVRTNVLGWKVWQVIEYTGAIL